MCSTKSAVSASSCVWSGRGRSVGRFPSSPPPPPPPRPVVLAPGSSLPPLARPTDGRRTCVVPVPASVSPPAPADSPPGCYVRWLSLSLSLSGPRSTQRFTDRSAEGKDGRRKSYCSLVFYLQFDCTYFAPLSISGMLLTLTSNSICPFHRHRMGRKDINIEIFIAHQPICTAAVANANGGATGAVRFCTV